MKLVATEKDKQNRPVAMVEISNEEIAAIKKAAGNHPKFKKNDELEGIRIADLYNRPNDEWSKLSQINIKDIKEVINKYIQDTGEDGLYSSLRDEFHNLWKQLNPS